MLSALIRMDDKMRRLENLVQGSKAKVEESIEDTLLDQIGYGILALVELRKQKEGLNG
ncbi:nucleotide modification associated domain-containing protein [Paenibacillus polymyxa]|uniref:nucleotide modification associated domain-containing protein n=1 Tax=Paenibacillus polymyxa TaxID=1406 RepID=UPI001E315759|nr:nucleotide modification associated domain-containing protein [Paenibacillus polymyxa]